MHTMYMCTYTLVLHCVLIYNHVGVEYKLCACIHVYVHVYDYMAYTYMYITTWHTRTCT